jgi:hypothetical protein
MVLGNGIEFSPLKASSKVKNFVCVKADGLSSFLFIQMACANIYPHQQNERVFRRSKNQGVLARNPNFHFYLTAHSGPHSLSTPHLPQLVSVPRPSPPSFDAQRTQPTYLSHTSPSMIQPSRTLPRTSCDGLVYQL